MKTRRLHSPPRRDQIPARCSPGVTLVKGSAADSPAQAAATSDKVLKAAIGQLPRAESIGLISIGR